MCIQNLAQGSQKIFGGPHFGHPWSIVTCLKKSLSKKVSKLKQNVIMLSSCNLIHVGRIKFNFVFVSTFSNLFFLKENDFSLTHFKPFWTGHPNGVLFVLSLRWQVTREGEKTSKKKLWKLTIISQLKSFREVCPF